MISECAAIPPRELRLVALVRIGSRGDFRCQLSTRGEPAFKHIRSRRRHDELNIEQGHRMKRGTRDRAGELPTTLGIVGQPSGFHLHYAERQSIRDHFAHSVTTGLSVPFEECVAFIGGLVWAPCTQTADDPARFVDAGCKKYRVGTIAEGIHVERLFDSVFAVVLICTANVVHPQVSLDSWSRKYDRALGVGIPTAGTLLQTEKVAARGLNLGNDHTCHFLGQPSNNGVAAGLSKSVSRHELPGFQLAIRYFPAE